MAIWGTSNTTGTGAALNGCIAMGGLFNPGSDGTLDSVEVYFSAATDLALVRVAIYQGGTSDVDPNGATLREDMGVGSGSATGWHTFTSSSNPTLTDNQRTWIVFKSNDAASGGTLVYSTNSGDAGDYYTAQGRLTLTGQTNSNQDHLPFPAIMDNTGSPAGNYWYSSRLNYTTGGGGGATAQYHYQQQQG